MLKSKIAKTAETGIIKAHSEWLKFAEEANLLRSKKDSDRIYLSEEKTSIHLEEKDESTDSASD